MSSATLPDHVQPIERLKDGPSMDWHPATISDRKLLELQQRLVKVQRLGDAFARIALSPQAQRRVRHLSDGA